MCCSAEGVYRLFGWRHLSPQVAFATLVGRGMALAISEGESPPAWRMPPVKANTATRPIHGFPKGVVAPTLNNY